jgi:hypothetical protein
MLKLIDKLLNGEGYSIEGARKQIELLKKKDGQLTLDLKPDGRTVELLDDICAELESIIRDLSRQPRSELDG